MIIERKSIAIIDINLWRSTSIIKNMVLIIVILTTYQLSDGKDEREVP